jgi:hypothetical protein
MKFLAWIMPGPEPLAIFYMLRTLFFLSSFVLGMAPHIPEPLPANPFQKTGRSKNSSRSRGSVT